MSDNKGEARRQQELVKQRNQMREEFERQKRELINETEKARPSTNRFVGQHGSSEEMLKQSTVGLVHLEEFEERRKEIDELKAREAAQTSELKYVRYHLNYNPLDSSLQRPLVPIKVCIWIAYRV
jgi:protein FAM50